MLVPTPFTGELWADIIKKKVGPWLKKTFPTKKSYHIILDGEKLLHCPVARAAMVAAKITVERPWPNNSPDLNPQENVWAIGEKTLRSMETGREPFELWKKLVQEHLRLWKHYQQFSHKEQEQLRLQHGIQLAPEN